MKFYSDPALVRRDLRRMKTALATYQQGLSALINHVDALSLTRPCQVVPHAWTPYLMARQEVLALRQMILGADSSVTRDDIIKTMAEYEKTIARAEARISRSARNLYDRDDLFKIEAAFRKTRILLEKQCAHSDLVFCAYCGDSRSLGVDTEEMSCSVALSATLIFRDLKERREQHAFVFSTLCVSIFSILGRSIFRVDPYMDIPCPGTASLAAPILREHLLGAVQSVLRDCGVEFPAPTTALKER